MEISSPITSDEEYLSPLEEAMDFGVQEPRRTIDLQFREPPSFLVRACNITFNSLSILNIEHLSFGFNYLYGFYFLSPLSN